MLHIVGIHAVAATQAVLQARSAASRGSFPEVGCLSGHTHIHTHTQTHTPACAHAHTDTHISSVIASLPSLHVFTSLFHTHKSDYLLPQPPCHNPIMPALDGEQAPLVIQARNSPMPQ
eukprot:scaffold147743_cov27-Tisochrysis_lutea.AAC.3